MKTPVRSLAGAISLAALVPSLLVPASLTGSAGANDREDPLPRVPPGFVVHPYAAIAGTPTSLDFGPGPGGDLRLYVADNTGGTILSIEDPGHTFAGLPPVTFASGFGGPLGVLVAADGTVFVADSEGPRAGPFGTRTYGRVWRVKDTTGDGVADVKEVVLKDLPNGRHNTNGMAFGPDGMLYVANGNSTDDGVLGGDPEVDPWSGAVVRVDPSATNVSLADLVQKDTLVATGMRNIYDVAFSPYDPTKLFIPMNGADDAGGGATAGLEDSDDLLYLTDMDDMRIVGYDENGEPILEPVIDDFGFPSCFYNIARKGNLEPYDNPSPSVISQFGPCPKETVPRPAGTFGLHVSADGMAFQTTDAWGPDYKNDAFVAEFGNFFGDDVVGHRVVRVEMSPDGERVMRHSEFLTGPAPLDVTIAPDGSLYVADFGGMIYKVMKVADVPREVTININAFHFTPSALTIPEGTTIKWVNNETVLQIPHNITGDLYVKADGTSEEGSEVNSANFGVGGSHSFRFETPGTFVYTCTFNPIHTAAMHGTITVVPAGN